MARISIFNMFIGFVLIFIAALGGPFLSQISTAEFVQSNIHQKTWLFTLLSSAHGHTNLFGMLHILMGLSFPYSLNSMLIKKIQSLFLLLGSFSMSCLLVIKAFSIPEIGFDILGIVMGIGLSAAICSIGLHTFGLFKKWMRTL